MGELAILLAGAAAGFGLARAAGLPALPVLLLVGIPLSPLLPGEFLEEALLLGLTFLVFAAGVALDPKRVGAQRKAALWVGALQFLLLGVAGYFAALWMGFGAQTSGYLALALTASSTLVGVRLLQVRRQLFDPFGRLVSGVLIFQDLLVILCIPVLTRLAAGPRSVAGGLAATLGLVALAYVCHRWLSRILVRRFELDEESWLLLTLALLFVFLGLAHGLELPLLAGAFLAGYSLSAFPVSAVVRGQLRSLSDFFSAIFFTALGAFLGFPTAAQVGQALIFAVLVVAITPPLVTLIVERTGFSARTAIASGLLLSQTSEFSLVVGLQGVVLGQIGESAFTIIVLVTVMTMILTPFLATDEVTWRLIRYHPFRRDVPAGTDPEGHVLLLGCGTNGMEVLDLLLWGEHEIVVVDEDPAVVERLREADVTCIRGDASDPVVLRSAGASRAKAIVSTIRRLEDNAPVLRQAAGVPVMVRGFNREDAEWIRARGGRAIVFSEAAAEDFLRWFEGEEAPVDTIDAGPSPDAAG